MGLLFRSAKAEPTATRASVIGTADLNLATMYDCGRTTTHAVLLLPRSAERCSRGAELADADAEGAVVRVDLTVRLPLPARPRCGASQTGSLRPVQMWLG